MSIYTKVCGLIEAASVRMVVKAKADAIGFNFYSKSKRYVATETAIELRKNIPAHIDVVGVFVNSSPADVIDICEAVHLDVIQFHGDESASDIKAVQDKCPGVKIFRAFRLNHDNFEQTTAELCLLKDTGVHLAAVLVDAFVAGEFGGTGHQLDHDLLKKIPHRWPPLIVAGGLTSENVADCIRVANPWGVDVASGVESQPGIKNPDKTKRFVIAAKSAG